MHTHTPLYKYISHIYIYGFLGGSESKESARNVGDPGSIPWPGRPLGGGNGYPLQYSCLENSTDREAWWATVHGVTKSQTGQNTFTFTFRGWFTMVMLVPGT